MHDLLMQAKGAKWAILAAASLARFLAGTARKAPDVVSRVDMLALE